MIMKKSEHFAVYYLSFHAVISRRHPLELVIFFQFLFFDEMLCTSLCCFVKNNKKICKTFVLLSAN